MLQGVWKQHLRPHAVVGYGVKIFLPSPPNYVTRSPGGFFLNVASLGLATRLTLKKKKNGAQCMSNIYISLQAVYMFKTLRITQLTTTSTWTKIVMQDNWTFKKCGKIEVINCCLKFFLLPMSAFMRCFSPTKWSHKQQTFKFLHATKVTKSIITVFYPLILHIGIEAKN